jgi:uncharacterized membrane protein YdcZ (DUF606 family)
MLRSQDSIRSSDSRVAKGRNPEPEVVRGLALAALLFGCGTLVAALAAGGSVAMIALGLILTALSMDLFRLTSPRDKG